METENYPLFLFISYYFRLIVLTLLCYFSYVFLIETETKLKNHEDENDEEDEEDRILRIKTAAAVERFAKISKRCRKLISDRVDFYELLVTIEEMGQEAGTIDDINGRIKELKEQKEIALDKFLSILPFLTTTGTQSKILKEKLDKLSLVIMKIEHLFHDVETEFKENVKDCESLEELTSMLKDVSETILNQVPKTDINILIKSFINICDNVDQISYLKPKWTEITDLLIKS